MYLGVKAVVAKSFERIHTANLINFGIVPLTFVRPEDYDRVDQGDEIGIPDILSRVGRETLTLVDHTKGIEVALECELSERQRGILLAGGLLGAAGS
jgi:aconitate hydratase